MLPAFDSERRSGLAAGTGEADGDTDDDTDAQTIVTANGVCTMMMNYAIKKRPRRTFGKRSPAPRKL